MRSAIPSTAVAISMYCCSNIRCSVLNWAGNVPMEVVGLQVECVRISEQRASASEIVLRSFSSIPMSMTRSSLSARFVVPEKTSLASATGVAVSVPLSHLALPSRCSGPPLKGPTMSRLIHPP
jgi:hypothetical protein